MKEKQRLKNRAQLFARARELGIRNPHRYNLWNLRQAIKRRGGA